MVGLKLRKTGIEGLAFKRSLFVYLYAVCWSQEDVYMSEIFTSVLSRL